MRMAVTATPSFLTMYGTEATAASFQAPSFSGLPMNDIGPLTLGSSLTMGGNSSFYSNYSDNSSTFGGPWDSLYSAMPSSIFNTPSLSFSESSVYSTDDSDLQPLMSSDSEEFFPQINGCSSVHNALSTGISTMHPNLVSTLKNMVAPGQISQAVEMYSSAQLDNTSSTTHAYLEQFQQEHSQQSDSMDTLRSVFLRHCQQSVVTPKVELQDFSSAVGAVTALPSHSVIDEEHLKAVEKSETEDDNIEAAVVSVDLIKNKRPFKCHHSDCNKTFKNPQTMKMHHKTHYSDGSAASKDCALPSSLKAGHNKKIPSRCPKCKETFVGLYELRRHYGRKHSEGEKPFGCRKCDKKFYIEVDVRDHEKLCGKPIECRCGLKFAFKCNLVAHKKAHPACQDHQTMNNNNNSSAQSPTSNNSNSSSSDAEHSAGSRSQRAAGCKRPREDSMGAQSGLPIPLPDFKGIPEAPPEFKMARRDMPLCLPSELSSTSWGSNMVYPSLPTFSFANLPVYTKLGSSSSSSSGFHQQFQHQPYFATKPSSFEAVNCAMGTQLPFKARSG